MKSKKKVITLVIIIALLALGVGYAALTQTLTINGTVAATADTGDFSVIFNKDAHTITTDGCTASYTSTTVATMTVTGLHKAGDDATATFQIKNASEELGANVTVAVTDVTGTYADYFTVTCTPNAQQSITAGGTKDYTVTVTLDKTVAADIAAQNFTVTFTATAVEE